MADGASLAARQILALLSIVLFHVLALALIVVLLGTPVFTIASAGWGVGQVKLLVLFWMGGAIVLWSIVPRIDRFEEPGPRLDPAEHPRLFELLEQVAHETGQRLPEEVYLVDDVTAFVAPRGGWMGIGSRRVMGIGLPLLCGLTPEELRAVIAHEFGHFAGREMLLGPWIHKARATMLRTVENLEQSEAHFDGSPYLKVLKLPFESYTRGFLRLTQSTSRMQELAADRLAAEVAGTQSLVTALAEIERLAAGYETFGRDWSMPALRCGVHPPLAAGFQEFMHSERVRETLGERATPRKARVHTSPYDSHPPVHARIRALGGQLPETAEADTGMRALELLGDGDAAELELLPFTCGERLARKLEPVDWRDCAERAFRPTWEEFCEGHAVALRELRVSELPALLTDLPRLAASWGLRRGRHGTGAELASIILWRAFALVLVRQGWEFRSQPGEDFELRQGDLTVQPLPLLSALAKNAVPAAAWEAWCTNAGLGEARLWPAAASAA